MGFDGEGSRTTGPTHPLISDKPVGNALKTRPPERPDAGPGQMIAEGVDPLAACQMTLVTPLTDDSDMRQTLQAAVETFFV